MTQDLPCDPCHGGPNAASCYSIVAPEPPGAQVALHIPGAISDGGVRMRLTTRTGTAMLALVLAGGAATALSAQNYGLPLFTNPRISTGIRLHADFGRPGDAITLPDGSTADLTILQGGLSFAIGPVGINAAVAANQADIKACSNQSTQCDVNTTASAGVLAQIKAYGGGRRNVSVSLFGGASTDITAWDVATSGELPKQLNIPLGVAIGYRLPLRAASRTGAGGPRYRG